ncbi:MAG: cytochrome-c oxidase, cbb3-type subunit III [Alphaproteobacteria bacterium]|nr:cytochrome-c oxidase, cbb3-type subunit III [Alphaproteobacteria bacterium]
MPTKVEKDAITGQDTTGHEWDGIKELNTPLPKWWLYTFYASIVYAVIWWVLYPSWPYVTGYFGGILGGNQRIELDQRLADARARQAVYLDRIATASTEEILADPDLVTFALAGGAAAFADNCAPCHGLGGAGQDIYPTLADDDWIWGGSLEDIQYTINYGVRNDHEDARINEMPAFGRDQLLEREDIQAVTQFVLSLSNPSVGQADDQGRTLYEEQCAACHGEEGEGIQELGAPNLADQIWLYGGSAEAVAQQIGYPQHGVMPPWIGRLDEETVKILAVYVHTLGGGQ